MPKKKLPGCVLVLLWGLGTLFVLTLLIGLLGRSLPDSPDPLEVSSTTWVDEWPFAGFR